MCCIISMYCTGSLHHFWVGVGKRWDREWISASSTLYGMYRRYITHAALYIYGNISIIPLCGNAKRLNRNEKCCNMIQMNVKLYRYPSWECVHWFPELCRNTREDTRKITWNIHLKNRLLEKVFYWQRKVSTCIRLYQNFIGFTQNFRMHYKFSSRRIATTTFPMPFQYYWLLSRFFPKYLNFVSRDLNQNSLQYNLISLFECFRKKNSPTIEKVFRLGAHIPCSGAVFHLCNEAEQQQAFEWKSYTM